MGGGGLILFQRSHPATLGFREGMSCRCFGQAIAWCKSEVKFSELNELQRLSAYSGAPCRGKVFECLVRCRVVCLL